MKSIATILAALLLALVAPACAYRVSPPIAPAQPVSVFIADYGYHASLLLPRSDTQTAEYAYGQYHWFALNQDNLWRAPGTLLLPGDGTLGRRDLPVPCSAMALLRATDAPALIELRVEDEQSRALLHRLDERFAAGGEPLDNRLAGLAFVRDPQPYSLVHTCNGQLAQWLRELGCRVENASLDADFRVPLGSLGAAVHQAKLVNPPAPVGPPPFEPW